MIRRSLGACLLLLACASTEAPATPPSASAAEAPAAEAPVDPPPATPSPEPDDSPWHWRSDAIDDAAPSYLVGAVGQIGVERCRDGGSERQWFALRPTIGRVEVSGPEAAVLDPLMDQPVLALGQITEAPRRPEEPIPESAGGRCMPMQMRMDWRITPRGMRIDRPPAPTVAHFEVDAVRSLHELQIRLDGEHVLVTLINPVPVPLADVELRVHYEGCFGKPGTTAEVTRIGELGVGAQASARTPVVVRSPDGPDGRQFRAYSVQLVGHGEAVTIDLDVPLADVGAGVECPGR